MSKSDAQRRSYLADQMTMGERVEAVTQKLDSVDNRLGELEGRVHHEIGEDVQYFHDELRSLGRRVGVLEKVEKPHSQIWEQVSYSGDVVAFRKEVIDRWRRIEEEHAECKAKLEEANNLADALRRDWSDIAERLKAANFRTGNAIERYEAKLARAGRIEEAAKTVVATIDSCKGWSDYHVTFASLREALKP